MSVATTDQASALQAGDAEPAIHSDAAAAAGETPVRFTAPRASADDHTDVHVDGRVSRLFVGNLDKRLGEKHIRQIFEKKVRVRSITMMSDKNGGDPRGYCFVECYSWEDANLARSEFDQKIALGRPMKVDFAKTKSDHISANTGEALTTGRAINSKRIAVGEGSEQSAIAAIEAQLNRMERNPIPLSGPQPFPRTSETQSQKMASARPSHSAVRSKPY